MMTKARSDYMRLVNKLPLVKIANEAQYKSAIRVIKELAIKDVKMSKGELQYFEVLSLLIKRYEEERFPATYCTPQEILRSFMADHDLTQAAIAEIADDYESNISAFLANKRNLSKHAALRLAKRFAVDPAFFLRPRFEQVG